MTDSKTIEIKKWSDQRLEPSTEPFPESHVEFVQKILAEPLSEAERDRIILAQKQLVCLEFLTESI